jgi:hypothetical protein
VRKRRRLAVAAALALLVALALILRSPGRGSLEAEYVVLYRPGVALDRQQREQVLRALRGNAPVPSGVAVVPFEGLRGSVGWNGRRRYVLTLLAPPGELVAVSLRRDGREEQRLVPAGSRTEVELDVEVPFWGDHGYELSVELSAGELSPFDFELYGTVSAGSLGIGKLARTWRAFVGMD